MSPPSARCPSTPPPAKSKMPKAVSKEIKALKNWLTPYETLKQRLEGALEMAELLEAEPDQALQADLAREADTLGLAAGERRRGAVERFPTNLYVEHPAAGWLARVIRQS